MRAAFAAVVCVVLVGSCTGEPPAPTDAHVDDAGSDASRTIDAAFAVDATTPRLDAGSDGGIDAGFDAGQDGGVDAGQDGAFDAGTDGGFDAGTDGGVDVGTDANDAGTDAFVATDAGAACLAGDIVLGAPPVTACAWLRQYGATWTNPAYTTDHAYDVHADPSGGAIVVGLTYGAFPGGSTAPTNGDAYVRRYDATGHETWTRQFGTDDSDRAQAVAVDGAGAVYVAGYVSGTLPAQVSAGGLDAFVRRYDVDGTEVWTRQFGTGATDVVEAADVDATGRVVVVGRTSGAFPGLTNAGVDDIFVRVYDASGAEVWTREFGTSFDDVAYAVAVDASDRVIVAGTVGRTLAGQTGAGTSDAVVRVYDATGAEVWTREFGSIQGDQANAVATTSTGDVVVAGYVTRTLPGQTGSNDAFVRVYDASGTERWTRQFGSSLTDSADAVSVTAAGSVIVSGYVGGALPSQVSAGSDDVFVRAYDPSGTELFTFQLGSDQSDRAAGSDLAASGHLYVVGYTRGTLPGQVSTGGIDAFAMRIAP